MKSIFKIIITLSVLMASPKLANAKLIYGLRGGINGTAISQPSNLTDGGKYSSGSQFGISIGYEISPLISVEGDLLYQSKSSKKNYSLENGIEDATININYFTIPLLLKAHLSDQVGLKNGWSIYGEAGPYYSSTLNSSINNSEVIISNYISENDYGFILGIGINKSINKLNMFADLRYERGIAEIIKYDTDLRSKSISLSVGINF